MKKELKLNEIKEEYLKYYGYIMGSGIHGIELQKAICDFWLEKLKDAYSLGHKEAKDGMISKMEGITTYSVGTYPPLGVSQWLEHGKRCGYNDLFEKKWIEEISEKLDRFGGFCTNCRDRLKDICLKQEASLITTNLEEKK